MPDDELQKWMTLSQSVTDDDRVRHNPPPSIMAKLLDSLDAPTAQQHAEQPQLDPFEEKRAPSANTSRIDRSTIAPVEQRRRRRQRMVAGIAVAGLFIIGIGLSTDGDDATTRFVGVATNGALSERFGGEATMSLEGDGERDRNLLITVSTTLPDTTPIELWAMTQDRSMMVSLGLLSQRDSTVRWPEGYDPSEFRVIDVSIEPDDGNPAHSGRSILRGELRPS